HELWARTHLSDKAHRGTLSPQTTSMSSHGPGRDSCVRQMPGSAHRRGVSVRRPRDAACRKTCRRGAKRTEIFDMTCSTCRLALWQGCLACRFNGRILLANLFQGSRSTLSCVSFPRVFAFQAGMWGTPISALLNSPTVSGRFLRQIKVKWLYGYYG